METLEIEETLESESFLDHINRLQLGKSIVLGTCENLPQTAMREDRDYGIEALTRCGAIEESKNVFRFGNKKFMISREWGSGWFGKTIGTRVA